MSALLTTGVQFPDNSIQTTAVQSAFIILWDGDEQNPPAGWKVCDGTNGTPDLRNRFIVGAGDTYSVGSTGGSASVTLSSTQIPQHSHPATVSLSPSGSHSHAVSISSSGSHSHPFSPSNTVTRASGAGSSATGSSGAGVNPIGPVSAHNHSNLSTGTEGDHTHSISIVGGSVGSGQAHENRPPYHALVFLMQE